jgi:uncharacterized DUF497 family protein
MVAKDLAALTFRYYNARMRIIFDPGKDGINYEKHGVRLDTANKLNWDSALNWQDLRRNYGEPRQCALAPLDDRLYFVAYVDRDDCRRIISLRKANNREVRFYCVHAN